MSLAKWTMVGVSAALACVILIQTLGFLGVFNTEVWTRESPLSNPTPVIEVRNGTVRLPDGRILRPAGVERRETVSQSEFDDALRVIVAQGVVITRDLGDGRAFLLAEPRFYNWCGTRGYGGNPWAHWAGELTPCPVSELLVGTGYARPVLDQVGMTNRERWRLEGVGFAMQIPEKPRRISTRSNALVFDPDIRCFRDYDTWLETMWHAPPGE